MESLLSALLYGVPILAIFGVGTWAVIQNNPRKERQRLHFRDAYGLSVERMIADSPVDRDEARRLRDSSTHGEMAAARYVMKWDPVPLSVAVEFVRGI